MGFMSPSLGFVSTAGAFIGGAAKQANENIEQSNLVDAATDRAWAVKADKAIGDWNKESQQISDDRNVYNTILDGVGGNKKAADMAYFQWKASGRKLDIGEITRNLIKNSEPLTASPADTPSRALGDLDNRQQQGQQNVTDVYGRVKPGYQKFMKSPRTPFGAPATGTGGMYAEGGEVDPNNPAPMPDAAPVPPVDTMAANPDVGYGGGEPDVLDQEFQMAQLAPGSGIHMGSGKKEAAGTGSTMTNRELLKPDQFDNPQKDYPEYLRRYNKDPANVDFTGITLKNPNRELMPKDFGHYENYDAAAQDFERLHLPPPPRGIMTADKIEAQKQKDRKNAVEDKANEDVAKAALITHQGQFIKGVYKEGTTVTNQAEIAHDADDIINMTTSGLKTNATQSLLDGMNRFLSSLGVEDLKTYGLSNSVANINEFQKTLGRLQFGQIPNYHLGRWTDREFATLNKMLPGVGNDENTNIKVALLLKSGAQRAIDNHATEFDALGDGSQDEVRAAMKLAREHKKVLADPKARLPWIEMNFANPSKEMIDAYNKAPEDSWIEVKEKPYVLNGKTYQPGQMLRK